MNKGYGGRAFRNAVETTILAFLLAESASALLSLGDSHVMVTECIHERTIL